MSIPIERNELVAYNEARGKAMIENLNDVLSAFLIVFLVVFALALNLSLFMRHRKKRIIQEEIEYYKEW
jgi:hypothetical protein